jgi:hypothetical protein
MQTINVWIEQKALDKLHDKTPAAVIVQNTFSLDSMLINTDPILCELRPILPVEVPSEKPKQLLLKIHGLDNFSEKEKAIVDEAKRIYEIVVNSPLYWRKVKAAWPKVTEKNGLSYSEFYDLVMSGDCKFTEADGTTDVKLVMYYNRFSKVVGYVLGDSFNIYINRKFFAGPLRIASNLNHESLHSLGFSHYGRHSTSVPYMVGNTLFEETWRELTA